MASTKLICRVCGKEYEGCRTAKRVDGVFRWQTVACSPECGSIYLSRILESRKKPDDVAASEVTEEVAESNDVEDTTFYDEIEEWFSDDEDEDDDLE